MRRQIETTWILVGAAFAVFVRSPLLLYHGKVFQEEGSDYYQGAVDLSPLHALLAVHVGYLSLFMNAYTFVVERLVSVERVSFAFTFAAFLMLLLTIYLALEVESFKDWRSRALAAADCVFVPSIEVWLALEDVQFTLPFASRSFVFHPSCATAFCEPVSCCWRHLRVPAAPYTHLSSGGEPIGGAPRWLTFRPR